MITERFLIELDNVDYSKLDPRLNWSAPPSKGSSTIPEQMDQAPRIKGIGLDWSDAKAAGYNMWFDPLSSSLRVDVGTSFNIDPTVVAGSNNYYNSPGTWQTYDGERRIIRIAGDNIFVFYYDGNHIKYRYSTDMGATFSAEQLVKGPTETGTGQLVEDTHRWSVVTTNYSGTDYIVVFYWKSGGSNMNFYFQKGSVSGTTITWNDRTLLGYTSAYGGTDCGSGGSCGGVAASTDTDGNIYAAFRWISAGASGYSYRIVKFTSGASSWEFLFSQVDNVSAFRPAMTISRLNSGDMLFAYAREEDGKLYYRLLDMDAVPPTWTNPPNELTSTTTGWPNTSVRKQISSDSDLTNTAYIAYVAGGTSGALKIAKFSNTGSFVAIESPGGTPTSHSLASITITPDSYIHIYSISGGKIYYTTRYYTSSTWETPVQVFDTGLNTAESITSAIGFPAALWREGSTSPYTLYFEEDPLDPHKKPAFRADWEYHPGGSGNLGVRAWITVSNPSITDCGSRDPNCLYESVIINYQDPSPNSNRGAVGSGWFKWKSQGSTEVWMSFFVANYDKKYHAYKKMEKVTSFPIERNFVVVYGEIFNGKSVWDRSVCAADPCGSGGTSVKFDSVTFDKFDFGHPRMSSWTTHSSVNLGDSTYAQFRDPKMNGYDNQGNRVWTALGGGTGFYCTTDSPYYIHAHSDRYHMGPPAGETNSCVNPTGGTNSVIP